MIAYWIIRSRRAATGAIDPAALGDVPGATPGGGDATPGAAAYHDPIVAEPGEWIYDPNTGKWIRPPDGDGGEPAGPTASPTPPPPPPAATPTAPRVNIPAIIARVVPPVGKRGSPPLKPGTIPALVHQLPAAGGLLVGVAVPAVNRIAPKPAAPKPKPKTKKKK